MLQRHFVYFLSHSYIKTIFLPRQVRDKHKESRKLRSCFLVGMTELKNGSLLLTARLSDGYLEMTPPLMRSKVCRFGAV
eukprot:COSAG06_NODE_1181_length_10363_cov_10.391563_9_plen_79_part_00